MLIKIIEKLTFSTIVSVFSTEVNTKFREFFGPLLKTPFVVRVSCARRASVVSLRARNEPR